VKKDAFAAPCAPIEGLSPLTKTERRQPLAEWNATAADYRRERCIHQWFEEQAARIPEAVALLFEEHSLSYGELNARANQLAHHLRGLGVGPDVLVGLCLERSFEIIVGLLGILKAGGAYLPLDPGYPPERLAFMLEDAQAPVLLTQQSLLGALPQYGGRRVLLDADRPAIAALGQDNPTNQTSAEHPLYLIYTSGSTGRPKGIMMPHRAVSNLIAWQINESALPEAVKTLQFASINFDVSAQEIFSTLCAGGSLVLAPELARQDPMLLSKLVVEAGIERLFLPFVALNGLAVCLEGSATPPATLKQVITAGEQLHVNAALTRLFERLPGCSLHNQYGPSESHVATRFRLAGAPGDWPALPPIGRPISNMQIHILDQRLNPVPVGVPGEIHIGGDGLARGYLKRPGLTAEKFIANPFGTGRLYKTGDLARHLPDGNIEFLGRIDHQVKIRGYRVELGEIESVLGQHPSVREAVVSVYEPVPGNKRLGAYLTAKAGETLQIPRLRQFLKDKLPEYMLPSAYVFLDSLPLTPSGKVDRKALPAPKPGLREASCAFAAPHTPTEKWLASIWEEILGIDRVGIHDNFFELGGHSLLAMQVIARIRQRLGWEVSPRLLFEAPSLKNLIECMKPQTENKFGQDIPLARRAHEGLLPQSFAQQRLWFLDRLAGASAAYNIPWAMRRRGRLDTQALRAALDEAVQRHESLRTTFAERDGEPVQIVHTALAIPWATTDLGGLPEARRDAERERTLQAWAEEPFDLAQGPLLRARLLRLGEDDHIFMLVMHHIISDGWSMGMLAEELSALYEAFSQGRPSPLPEPSLQYADYAVWQREWLRGELSERQLAYWKDRLAGSSALELPTDRPRPLALSHQGGVVRFVLPKDLRDTLAALARRAGATLFMVLLAAFQTLLHRYSGQDDIVVGTSAAGRARPELEGLVGFFVNTLLLRTDLSGDPSFRELLGRVRETALGAYAHQDLPFERLVEALHPQRDLSRHALFQTLFILQNAPDESLRLTGLDEEPLWVDTATAKLDLSLELTENPQGFAGRLEYSSDLYDAATAARMVGHFQTLLEGIAADPDARLSALPILTAAERRQLLEGWNDTAADFPSELCIHQLFERQVGINPEAVALAHGSVEISYASLNSRANQLAHRLRQLGVGPDMPVGLCLSRTPDLLVGLLGILKAGGAYLPLDPAYPAERLEFMLKDAQAPVLVTHAALTGQLPPYRGQLVRLDSDAALLDAMPSTDPSSAVTAKGLAYLIYTSGSTGVPKGVMIEHRNAVNLLSWARGLFDADEPLAMLAATSVCFDLSVFEIFLPLAMGGTVILADNALALPQLAAASRVRCVNTVPSALTALLQNDGLPAQVGTVCLAGEPLTTRLVEDICRPQSGRRVFDLYGPSETTTYSTFARRYPAGPATIGRPLANTQIYLLDRHSHPVPIGIPGEIHIGGAGLARGYLNRPELTEEKFIPNPFGTGRLYKTGDLARYLPDGNIEFLGRIDHQVKLRGFRIELGEIESALCQHPGIREAVVAVYEPSPGDKRLAAYLTAKPGAAPEDAELRERLKAKLPEYMLPSAYVWLDALPLTASGKVDRKALPAPDSGRRNPKAGLAAPRSPLEEMLAAIWAETLGLDHVGIRDSFFELGGHSLLAMRVIARIRQRLGREISLRTFFAAHTVAELAGRMQAEGGNQPLRDIPLARASREGAPPLSFAQQRLWFLDRLMGRSGVYNIPWAVKLDGPLDVAALQAALEEAVRRHEALRTTFAEQDGEPMQIVQPALPVSWATTDLGGLSKQQRGEERDNILLDAAQKPFDLERGPLLRACLLRLDEASHIFLLVLHHSIADGWSLSVLGQELSILYEAYSQGRPSPLPELPIQYADYAVWQREWLGGERLERQPAHWKQRLAGLSALELPTDRPRPAALSHRGGVVYFDVRKDLHDALDALARREGTTLFMVLLAAFQTLLHRHCGQDDIAIGTPAAGRPRPELENLIGFFANTIVLRTDLSGNPPFLGLLERVREVALDAFAHQDLPFGKLVEELHPQRDLARNPLFQAMFVLQNTPDNGLRLPGIEAEPLPCDTGTAKFDLNLELLPERQGLSGKLEYAADLFDAATAVRMAGHFQILLEEIAAHPATRLSQLPLLTAAERRQLLEEWNATAADFPGEFCIHQLFEAQAAHTPEAPALLFAEHSLSYGELNARANQLAHCLRGLGVGPDVLVGLCVERSFELVVGLLGILKAGGAYLPLEPGYPKERLAFMLEDAQTPVLLTQESLLDLLPQTDAQRLCLDRDWPGIARNSRDNPASQASPANLAYVIYTSGSTGEPKGVAVCHRNVARLVFGNDYACFDANQIFLLLAPVAFDASTFEIWGPLLHGARCAIYPPRPLTVSGLEQAIRQHQVTVLWLTASLFNAIIDANPEILATVSQVLTGGEALSIRHVRHALGALPDTRLVNGYGPTESTTFTCCHAITLDGLEGRNSVPIGRPIGNTQVYILDRHLNPAPVGVSGEIHIGGAGLARGYLNRPELTEEKFIPNPFGTGRLYKTGDLARYLPDGNIEFLGRIDHQVKLRGFRIELGEIESALCLHPGVREAVVAVYEPSPGDKRLAAYLTAKPGATLEDAELRERLKARLPEYMLPSAYVWLDALPLTPNGKVDRKALPSAATRQTPVDIDFVKPRDAIELQIMRIWGHLLGIEKISIRDNFFALGGHSLLAVTLLARIEQLFAKRLSLDTLWLQGGTIESLANALRGDGTSDLWGRAVAIQPRGSRAPLFCPPVAGGHLYHWDNVARHLGLDQPVYGLPAKGVDGGHGPDSSISDIAAHCIHLMKEVQPSGPYCLAGFCSGGMVAFEMARQLEANGESVALLAIVDSIPPRRGIRLLGELARVLLQGGEAVYVKERLEHMVRQSLRLPAPKTLKKMTDTHRWAFWDHVPKKITGRITLFNPADDEAMKDAPRHWGKLAERGLELHPLPGRHEDLTREPGVRLLARELAECLARAVP
jgi:amino acid adenylation domain-containing protein